MYSTGLSTGTIFPIVENGKEEMYITNAPQEVISSAYRNSKNAKGFIHYFEVEGYEINIYRSHILVNFDMKE